MDESKQFDEAFLETATRCNDPSTRAYLVELLNAAQSEVRSLHESEEGKQLLQEIQNKYEAMDLDEHKPNIPNDEDDDIEPPKGKAKPRDSNEDEEMDGSDIEEDGEDDGLDEEEDDADDEDNPVSVSHKVHLVNNLESEKGKELDHFQHERRIKLNTLRLDPDKLQNPGDHPCLIIHGISRHSKLPMSHGQTVLGILCHSLSLLTAQYRNWDFARVGTLNAQ